LIFFFISVDQILDKTMLKHGRFFYVYNTVFNKLLLLAMLAKMHERFFAGCQFTEKAFAHIRWKSSNLTGAVHNFLTKRQNTVHYDTAIRERTYKIQRCHSRDLWALLHGKYGPNSRNLFKS
jgi:hypothetical protein